MLSILLAALTFSRASTSHVPAVNDEIFVRTEPTVTVERLAKAIVPLGKLESRSKGSSLYLVKLNPGIEAEAARESLEKTPGIHPLDPAEEPVDMSSLRSLHRKIAHLKKGEHEEKGENGLDYLEAYEYFIGQRAFPNDTVDWSAYARAQKHAAGMKPTTLRSGGNTPATPPAWEFVGPTNLGTPYQQYFGIGPVNGRINALAYDPNNSQIIYAGAAQGGLFKSSDGGTTWTWLSSTWPQLSVSCIAISPQNSATIYVGLGDYPGVIPNGYGIMKTTDGGTTWTEIATAYMGKIGVPKILIDPTNDQTLVAGTGDENTVGAMYQSTDAGKTWKTVIPYDSGAYHWWPTIAASHPVGNKTRFYTLASDWGNVSTPTSRLYVSDDHGATWQNLASPINTDGTFHRAYWVCTSPTNPNAVYMLDSENVKLYSSTNQGSTWTDLSANLPNDGTNFTQSWYNYYLECGTRVVGSNSADVLYLGEIDITESVDGGQTWQSIGGPTYAANGAVAHNDQHALAVSPTNPNQAIFSGDGGIYSLTYSPTLQTNTVTPLSKNLGATMFYKIAAHPTKDNILLGGTQDNATPFSNGDFSNWLNVGGGDGGGSAINQKTPNIAYTSSQPVNGVANITRTPDGWQSQFEIGPSTLASENLAFVAPIVLDPSNPTKMYWATDYLYRWDEGTQSWSPRLGNQVLTAGTANSPVVQAIAVSPTNSNQIYTGSSDGAVWMTTDGGATWSWINQTAGSFPAGKAITSITVNPSNYADILVGVSGTGSGHLWRCTNTMLQVPSFVDVSGSGASGLPDIPLNAIALDLDAPTTTWWVATDIGVFQTADSGAHWTNAGAPLGLPNVIVDDLAAVPGTRYLNAGTYGRGMWRLYLPPGGPLTSLTMSPNPVVTGADSTGTVSLTNPAPTGGIFVNLTSSNTAAATVPSTVFVSPGANKASFTIATISNLTTTTTTTITATYSGSTVTQVLTVLAVGPATLSISPSPVTGGTPANGTITLNTVAPPGGLVVTLKSTSTAASVPSSVTVPAGAPAISFPVTTVAVSAATTATITATADSTPASTTLTVNPPDISSFTISPTSVVGGTSSSGTVQLTGPAPSAGIMVGLSSNNASVQPPATVTIPSGANYVTFSITTKPVATAVTASVQATLGSTKKIASLTATPPVLTKLAVSPTAVQCGSSATGTVTLNGPAPVGGIAVNLSSNTLSATVPSSVTVAAGATSGTFTITTSGVSTVTNANITASQGGASFNALLTINPATFTSLTLSPTTVVGGNPSTGTVTLSGVAPSSGLKLSLSSSNKTAVVPQSITIPAGQSSATFAVSTTTVTAATSATITASLSGTPQSAVLTIQPLMLVSVAISPSTVAGGVSASGSVNLNGPAPSGGLTISLKSSNANVTVPATVKIPVSAMSATFVVGTKPVAAPAAATVTATYGKQTASAGITVEPPSLISLSLSPATLVGGSDTAVKGTLTLSGPTPSSGITVSLSSSNTKAATVPLSVHVVLTGNARTATFVVTHLRVTSSTTVTIKATFAGVNQAATLTVDPMLVTSLTVSPATVKGSSTTVVTGTVTINAPAPAAGITITLTSSKTTAATVPATVHIASGKTTATFAVSHKKVTTQTPVTITGSLSPSSAIATLIVAP